MFILNLKLFLRKIQKDKSSFLINVTGLSTGLACVILIYLWVSDEISVDAFHENNERIYQVLQHLNSPQGINTVTFTPYPLAKALAEEMPEVEIGTSINNIYWFNGIKGLLTTENISLKAKGMFVDEHYFQVFSYDFLEGSKLQALEHKNSVVLSEQMALKVFNSTTNVLGKTLVWEHDVFQEKLLLTVTGVFKDPPKNATIQADLILNFDLGIARRGEYAREWYTDAAYTYLLLKEGTNIDQFNQKIKTWMRAKHSIREKNSLAVQQFSERYLHGEYENGIQVGGRIAYVKLFSMIALFILLIACINFVNLSTGQVTNRMKEIGVIKAIGANRRVFIIQFLSESMMLVGISMFIACLIVWLLLPQFNLITDKSIVWAPTLPELGVLLALGLMTSLLAGSYPAFFLSGFKPIGILNSKMNTPTSAQWLRSGLVIFQFSISIILMVGVLVINRQLEFTQQKNLGYQRDHLVSFHREGNLPDAKAEVFMAELKRIPGVANASSLSGNFLTAAYGNNSFNWEGMDSEGQTLFPSPQVSYDFIETMGMELLQGRSFSHDFSNEESNIVLNESAAKLIGFDQTVGKEIRFGEERRQIIGVVSDFHLGSLYQKVEPLFFRFSPDGKEVMVKIQAGEEMATIERMRSFYEEFFPGKLFEFTFMDDDYQRLYSAEQKVATLCNYFSMLAIVISCLGLFGLAAFTIERRNKEIGIRKALGQSSLGVMFLLSKEFAKLVLLAICIGMPIAYILSRDWLSKFAYKINLEVWYFLLVGLIALMVAIATVSSQSVRAAFKNPIEALREE